MQLRFNDLLKILLNFVQLLLPFPPSLLSFHSFLFIFFSQTHYRSISQCHFRRKRSPLRPGFSCDINKQLLQACKEGNIDAAVWVVLSDSDRISSLEDEQSMSLKAFIYSLIWGVPNSRSLVRVKLNIAVHRAVSHVSNANIKVLSHFSLAEI